MKVCHKPGRKTFVHVNMAVFRRNLKNGTNEPAITVKGGQENYYGYAAMIAGPAYLEYSGNGKPLLSCGARVAVTSRYPVEVSEELIAAAPVGKRRLFISRSAIRSNKVKGQNDPVIGLIEDGKTTFGFGAKIDGDVVVRQCFIEGKLSLVIETNADVILDTNPPVIEEIPLSKSA